MPSTVRSSLFIPSLAFRWILAIFFVFFSELFLFLFQSPTQWVVFSFFDLFSKATFQGSALLLGPFTIELIAACVAPAAYALLAVLILLTKDLSWKKRLQLFVVGSALLLALNVARILFLIEILVKHGINYFEAVHLFFWWGMSSLFVVGVWIALITLFKVSSIPVYDDLRSVLKL